MFYHFQHSRFILFFFFMFILPFFITSCRTTTESDPLKSQFSLLDEVVEKKKTELLYYLDMIEKSVSSIQENGPLIESFQHLNLVYNAYRDNAPISKFDRNIEDVIIDVYMNRFMVFENIYFINTNGDVFYSLIKNKMTLGNVFKGPFATTNLSKMLRNNPNSYMVDFDTFPDLDPAAFFIHPVYINSSLLGWCVFELGADRLDTIFSSTKQLGETGEVLLVNEKSVMLTEPHLSPELSTLKQHLSPENIETKFKLGKGHLEITDYRGYKALSSFEVVTYHKVRWLISAKKDVDEVLTQQFMEKPLSFYMEIRKRIQTRKISPIDGKSFPTSKNEVRLDQFKRISSFGDLYTHGVSTCTAILITLPEKFSYLAHISAYDVLYGGEKTDIIGNIFERIKMYEIPDYRLRELRIYIVTPHIQFDQNILRELVNQGLLLSQIFVAKNPAAKRGNVYYSIESNQGFIRWDLENGTSIIESMMSLIDVGSYLYEIIYPPIQETKYDLDLTLTCVLSNRAVQCFMIHINTSLSLHFS